MKIIITSSLLVALFSACSMHRIEYNDKDKLSISLENKTVAKGYGDVIYKNQINLSHIVIKQKAFSMKNGIVLTYEEVQTAPQYKFNFGMNKTVGLIFTDYVYDFLDSKGNIHFFILTNKKTKDKVYLLLENINKKSLKLVYGFKKETFYKLKELLVENKAFTKDDKVYTTILKANKSDYITSNWNANTIILDNIVSKMGGKPPVTR